ncbi:hypothetical protein like AT3G24255 [Hibiscus trionum]|uniref:Reverse transcriptase n=1 Tax=Hibiscus trionum TaxID=183268 RepID=A0A9W7H9D7_HIBTR|nr:hypothetical protein like AT3G24255 [Hibiscus trionum]
MRVLKETLDIFCACSGHRVSSDKTTIYFSKNCSKPRGLELVGVGGFKLVDDLGMYLGVPLLHKRVTSATYKFLIEKVESRLSGWAARVLSLAGRITLAKAVLQAIPTYIMQTAWLPKSICEALERIIQRFIWGSPSGSKGIPLVRWTVITTDVQERALVCGNLDVKTKLSL